MAGVKNLWMDGVLFVLASPILALKASRRAAECYRFFRLAMAPAIVCECGAEVPLVGIWKCSCNSWVYRGHLLRPCPVCLTTPCVVRCYQCGVTTKLPEAS
ncbi:MAG: hypothetical protein EPN47_13815 [Acidobacteria bacterium]|nr:MAG: hypothetical protein EPN47_13815 [Acidobacteriota bacterium]